MKSKRAKECADRYISTGVHKGVHHYKYVIQAIELAEQDAEERHAKEMEKMKERAKTFFINFLMDYGIPDPKVDVANFEDALNNGGQGNENN